MLMRTVFYVISDNGDGSQSVHWVKDCTYDMLEEFCSRDECGAWYVSGDGVQITEVRFPHVWKLDAIEGFKIQTFDEFVKDHE